MVHSSRNPIVFLLAMGISILVAGCAPRVLEINPPEGSPGTVVSVSLKNLVGWPRVSIGNKTMDWPRLRLMAAAAERKNVPGEELVWIEDKILEFTIPDLPPAEYQVIIHDDKGPPNDPIYSFLETTAYVIFPPVWPYVFRSNQAEFKLRVLPAK